MFGRLTTTPPAKEPVVGVVEDNLNMPSVHPPNPAPLFNQLDASIWTRAASSSQTKLDNSCASCWLEPKWHQKERDVKVLLVPISVGLIPPADPPPPWGPARRDGGRLLHSQSIYWLLTFSELLAHLMTSFPQPVAHY